ncbi:MAG: hypothetical protein WC205_06235 [Opitutaceae bacterium]|jgi:hypothetical protein
MNSTVWYIFKKDLVRFRLQLVVWCVLLVARVMCVEWAAEPEYTAQGSSAMMWVVLVFLFNVHLVVRVLAEDSPLKEAAFWRTRPIQGGQMLAAKVLFVTGWTVVLPAGVIAAAAIYYGFTPGEVLKVVAGQALLHGFIAWVFLAVTSFFQRVIASIFCFLLLGVFTQLAVGRRFTTETVATFVPASLVVTRTVVSVGLLLAGCGLAIWLVYRSRRRTMAAVVLAVGLAGMKLTASLWPWDGLGWVSVLKDKEPRADAGYVVTLAQAEASGRSSSNGVDYRLLNATFEESGLQPAEITCPYRFEGRVVWADGKESLQNREGPISPAYDVATVLRSTFGVEEVPRSRYVRSGLATVTLAQLRDTEVDKLRQSPAEWRGRIASAVGRIAVKAKVSLRAGASAEEGAYRLVITEVVIGRDELEVKLTERRADFGDFITWQPEAFALINVRRKEALLETGGGSGGGMSGGLFKYSRSNIRFSTELKSRKLTPAELADWLKDAELVRFQFQEDRRVITEKMVVPLMYRE